jgi:NADH:ubiquinone oxidoreductase subunit H
VSVYPLLIGLISIFFIITFLLCGTFLSAFYERVFAARIQHRDGPGTYGKVYYFQVWKDFLKIRYRKSANRQISQQFMILIWASLPVFFLCVLLGGFLPAAFRDAGLWVLIFLLLLSVVIESLLLHFTDSNRERLIWREPLLLKILGVSAIIISSIALSMRVGGSDLSAISSFQLGFPFHSIFKSPGLFLLALLSFGSIYLVVGDAPIGSNEEKSLGGSAHYLIFFVRKMWSFSLISFWVFLYFGGFSGFFAKVAFPIKAASILLVYVLLQISVPLVRTNDAASLALRWLLTFCFIGFALEVIWMGIFI